MPMTNDKYRGLTYRWWWHMRRRCHDPRDKNYPGYGGRGVVMCEAWRASWRKCIDDVIAEAGPRPSPKHQIDRIDNDRGYEPGNVRWVTSLENNNNRRSNRFVSYGGETLTAAQWGRRFGVRRQRIANELNRGRTPEEVIGRLLRREAEIEDAILDMEPPG